MTLFVKCPHCFTEVVWTTENLYRPFCSKRCKLIDFGDWADGSHKIPAEMVENSEDFSELDISNHHMNNNDDPLLN